MLPLNGLLYITVMLYMLEEFRDGFREFLSFPETGQVFEL